MFIDELVVKSHTDSFYSDAELEEVKDGYCPECNCHKVFKIKGLVNEFYCVKCNCQWSE